MTYETPTSLSWHHGGRSVNEFHLQFCASPEWRQIVEETILPRALEGVDLGPTVLEIGPGPGFTTDVLMTRVDHLTAVEVDVDLARALSARMAGTNVDVVLGDATALEFPDGHFTGAASFQMLHHIESDDDQKLVFTELARVLAPSATLVAVDGIENEATRAHHDNDIYNPIDPDDLRRWLADAGFSAIDVAVYELGWMCTARV
jgi:SAM-dependent methyltransferase